jgi:hypothetical protein
MADCYGVCALRKLHRTEHRRRAGEKIKEEYFMKSRKRFKKLAEHKVKIIYDFQQDEGECSVESDKILKKLIEGEAKVANNPEREEYLKECERNLEGVTIEKVVLAYKSQQAGKHYTFYQERDQVESVFNTRINFLLVIYTLFVTVFFQVANKHDRLILLSIGCIITLLLSLTIWRIHQKLDILLNMLYALGEEHPFRVIDKVLKNRCKFIKVFGRLKVLAIGVPLLLIISFVVAIVAIALDFWK